MIYLDHGSTSPLRPEALEAMLEWMGPQVGDPTRIHSPGRLANYALENSRQQVAHLVGVRPRQVIFTSGATEAINTACWSCVKKEPDSGIITSPIEHSSVRGASKRASFVIEPEVDSKARLDIASLEKALSRNKISLVNIQLANHEVGTIQPVSELANLCHKFGAIVHSDGASALGAMDVNFESLGIDMLSISSHKIGGPSGVGALVIKKGLSLEPLLLGGQQERFKRAGMPNLAGIVGFGKVAELLTQNNDLTGQMDHFQKLYKQSLSHLLSIQGVRHYGPEPPNAVSHIISLDVKGLESESILLGLDQLGFALHAGSACSSLEIQPSSVLQAMKTETQNALRISFGWSNTEKEIQAFNQAFSKVVADLQSLSNR